MLNEWTHGDLISVQMLGLIHPEFASMGQRNERLWKNDFSGLQEADYNRDNGITGYAWLARYTRAFLDDYLKHGVAAATFLRNTPAANGVPAHVMGVKFRSAANTPVSFASFRVQVGRVGFDHAVEIYNAMRKDQPEFQLEPGTVVSWAYELLADRHFSEAVNVMKLGVSLDSSSSAFTDFEECTRALGTSRKRSRATGKRSGRTPITSLRSKSWNSWKAVQQIVNIAWAHLRTRPARNAAP